MRTARLQRLFATAALVAGATSGAFAQVSASGAPPIGNANAMDLAPELMEGACSVMFARSAGDRYRLLSTKVAPRNHREFLCETTSSVNSISRTVRHLLVADVTTGRSKLLIMPAGRTLEDFLSTTR